jgi:hypothetical protein
VNDPSGPIVAGSAVILSGEWVDAALQAVLGRAVSSGFQEFRSRDRGSPTSFRQCPQPKCRACCCGRVDLRRPGQAKQALGPPPRRRLIIAIRPLSPALVDQFTNSSRRGNSGCKTTSDLHKAWCAILGLNQWIP